MTRERETNGYTTFKHNFAKFIIKSLAWCIVGILYYAGFSLIFDTPTETYLKESTDKLSKEYEVLTSRYDSLTLILDNIAQRDSNVFQILFDASPYNIDELERTHILKADIDKISTHNLSIELEKRTRELKAQSDELAVSAKFMQEKVSEKGDELRNIPAIQPINNNELSLLTASYGMLIHPFYKTLHFHDGVDYTVPEGTRVFATADGVVKKVVTLNSTSGKSITIDHGNGYETTYNHLEQVNIGRGTKVRRGDIIARSGNTGLSLTPHLHYKITLNGESVNPINYFFMELSPIKYHNLRRIAEYGMQSFD